MKKIIIVSVAGALLFAAGSLVWFFYGSSSSGTENALYKGTITIGYTTWPGYLGLYVARDKALFKAEGVNVEIKKYNNLAALAKDYTDGTIQGAANLNFDAVSEAYDGLDQKVVAVIDYSNGSDGIIASTKIHSIPEVKGKKFAFEFGTLEEFFTRSVLAEYRMSVQDIVPVNLSAENAAKALVDGKVDVATTYEPFLTTALQKAGGNKIYSSAQAPGLIVDLLTFRTDFIQKYPDAVQAIVRAYFKGIQFWKDQPNEANRLLAKELGATTQETTDQLSGVKVLDLPSDRGAFTYSPGLQSIYTNLRRTSGFIAQLRGKPVLDTDGLVDPAFVHAL